MNTAILQKPTKSDVWYKEPWLLLVVGGPLIVVFASIFTGLLAMRGADQVVAKDYYKQGLMINTNLQRDAKARELNLRANMQLDFANKRLSLELQSKAKVPDSVQLSIATSGAQSGSVEEVVRRLPLKLVGDSKYSVDLSQFSSTTFEELCYFGERFLVHHQLTVEVLDKTRFGQIVAGGTEATSDQHDVGTLLSFSKCSENFRFDITNRGLANNLDTSVRQFHAHPLRIRIYYLSVKNFVADCEEFSRYSFHGQK